MATPKRLSRAISLAPIQVISRPQKIWQQQINVSLRLGHLGAVIQRFLRSVPDAVFGGSNRVSRRWRRMRSRVSFALLVGGIFEAGLAHAQSMSCSLVFWSNGRGNPAFLEGSYPGGQRVAWERRFQMGRLGKLPSLLRDKMEAIHIVSQTAMSQGRYQSLRRRTEEVIGPVAEKLRSYGFVPQGPLYIIVENHPQTVLVRQNGGQVGGRGQWGKRLSVFPGMAGENAQLGIPGPMGEMTWVGHLGGRRAETRKFLLFSALTENYHTLDNKFMVAHEWAHTTEPLQQPMGRIWREARADLLAYLATGETALRIPRKLAEEEGQVDRLANEEKVHNSFEEGQNSLTRGPTTTETVTLRSLREPTMRRFSGAVSAQLSAHLNSQIISSALYAVARAFGDRALADFIHWMDYAVQEGALATDGFERRSATQAWVGAVGRGFQTAPTEAAYWRHKEQMIRDTSEEIQGLGQLILSWAEQQRLDMAVIGRIVGRRGLDVDYLKSDQNPAAQ